MATVKGTGGPTAGYAAGRDAAKDDGNSPDGRLRRFGFFILSRPSDGPATWGRRGSTLAYTEAEAHRQVDAEVRCVQTTRE